MKKHVIAIYTTTILLSLAGMAFIYSASRYSAAIESGDAFFYVKKQAIAFAIGLFLMFAVRIFDVEKLKKAKYPVMISSLILLALVFVPKLGVESFGAKRWINLGFFTIQPSEYAKFGFVIFAADRFNFAPAQPPEFRPESDRIVSYSSDCCYDV